MICCSCCRAYTHQTCHKLGSRYSGRSVGGTMNLRLIRSGLHPDYRSELLVASVSAKQAAASAAAVQAHVAKPPPPPPLPVVFSLNEHPHMRELRARIAAKEQA